MNHSIRVISLTVKAGTEFLWTNKFSVSTQKADHIIFLFLVEERREKAQEDTRTMHWMQGIAIDRACKTH